MSGSMERPGSSNGENAEHLTPKQAEEVVERRRKNQESLCTLFRIAEARHAILSTTANEAWERDVFHLLVGAGFALWRSAFLCHAARTPPILLGQATALLNLLLRDNAFTYPNERTTKEWTVGFYLNDARYRLIDVSKKVSAHAIGDPKWSEVINRKTDLPPENIGNLDASATDRWDTLQKYMSLAAEALEKHLRDAVRT